MMRSGETMFARDLVVRLPLVYRVRQRAMDLVKGGT